MTTKAQRIYDEDNSSSFEDVRKVVHFIRHAQVRRRDPFFFLINVFYVRAG